MVNVDDETTKRAILDRVMTHRRIVLIGAVPLILLSAVIVVSRMQVLDSTSAVLAGEKFRFKIDKSHGSVSVRVSGERGFHSSKVFFTSDSSVPSGIADIVVDHGNERVRFRLGEYEMPWDVRTRRFGRAALIQVDDEPE